MMGAGGGFILDKWYLDCVTVEGATAVAYWASLGWRRLRIVYQQLSVSFPGQPRSSTRTSLAHGAPPAAGEASVVWTAEALGGTIEAHPRRPPIRARLLETGSAFVDWCCLAPAADVQVDLGGGASLRGGGYVERLVISIPPWRLPIDELRWGRWIDGDRSLVWIDWCGSPPRRWVYLDGVPQPDTDLDDEHVLVPTASLGLHDRRTLSHRSFAEILAPVPALRAAVPAALLGMEETKWLSRGVLAARPSTTARGWAIHERVRFR